MKSLFFLIILAHFAKFQNIKTLSNGGYSDGLPKSSQEEVNEKFDSEEFYNKIKNGKDSTSIESDIKKYISYLENKTDSVSVLRLGYFYENGIGVGGIFKKVTKNWIDSFIKIRKSYYQPSNRAKAISHYKTYEHFNFAKKKIAELSAFNEFAKTSLFGVKLKQCSAGELIFSLYEKGGTMISGDGGLFSKDIDKDLISPFASYNKFYFKVNKIIPFIDKMQLFVSADKKRFRFLRYDFKGEHFDKMKQMLTNKYGKYTSTWTKGDVTHYDWLRPDNIRIQLQYEKYKYTYGWGGSKLGTAYRCYLFYEDVDEVKRVAKLELKKNMNKSGVGI